MRARCREFNWARTSLGPVSEWPDALAFSVRMVMANGIPGLVLWGRELTQIYNDAFIEQEQQLQSDFLPFQGVYYAAFAPWGILSCHVLVELRCFLCVSL